MTLAAEDFKHQLLTTADLDVSDLNSKDLPHYIYMDEIIFDFTAAVVEE